MVVINWLELGAKMFEENPNKWFSIPMIQKYLSVEKKLAENICTRLVTKGAIKKYRSNISLARVVYANLVAVNPNDELFSSEDYLSRRLKSNSPNGGKAMPVTILKRVKLKKQVVQKKQVDPLAGAPLNAIKAIEAIGSMAEDNVLMKSTLMKIKEIIDQTLIQIDNKEVRANAD